ncbi:MAG: roadblock/LC7 domain-containing protein [Pseudomonadota bacterium]
MTAAPPQETTFTPILRRVVERVPGAVGVIFADWDGEAVDAYSLADRDQMLVLAAHYGIILNQLQSALHLFHFGEAIEALFEHDKMCLVLRVVGHGYYVILALDAADGHIATALREIKFAADALMVEL